MKKPDISALVRGVTDKLGTIGKAIGGGVRQSAQKAGSLFSGLAAGLSETTRRIIVIAAVALGGLLVIAVLASLLFSALPRREPASVATTPASVQKNRTSLPQSGPALASMLLIPELDEAPYPLAREPKALYTEADAAAVRPYVGDIDVSEFTRRRKAELEAIFGAVD